MFRMGMGLLEVHLFFYAFFKEKAAMGMNRTQKADEVSELKERFSNDEIVVVTHYTGLTVADVTKLRSDMRSEGASFKVAKNSLAKIAIKGTRYESLANLLTGQTGLATSKDPITAARVAYNFAKTNEKLVIIGGAMGEKILDAEAVKQLAQLPSLDALRSMLIGLLQAPATKLAGLMQAPARELVGVTKAYGAKEA